MTAVTQASCQRVWALWAAAAVLLVGISVGYHYWLLVSASPLAEQAQAWQHFLGYALVMAATLLLLLVGIHRLAISMDRKLQLSEQAQKTDKAILESLLNSAADGVVTIDLDGQILNANVQAANLFGEVASALLMQSIGRFLPADYQQVDLDYRRFDRELCVQRPGYVRHQLIALGNNGQEFPVEVTIARLSRQSAAALLLIIRDLSDSVRIEQELEDLRLQYFQQEKMAQIGLLVGGILHEVGNPLAAIRGLLEEILYEDRMRDAPLLNEHYRGNIEMVLEQTERIRSINQEVSGYLSPGSSLTGLVDVNQVLRNTVKLLGYDKRWRGIRLELHLDDQLPAVEGVSDQLTQVFMNLLVNASDAFAGVEGRSPWVRVTSRVLGNDLLLVSIRDNGSGIDSEAMQHIFRPFYTTKEPGKGTGLGLSICERLVEEHNGTMEMESTLGEGTDVRLYFYIPADTQSKG